MKRNIGAYGVLGLCGLLTVIVLATVALTSAIAQAGEVATAQSRSAPDPCTWTSVTTISPGSLDNYLNGVSATSSTDAWAVGSYTVGTAANTLAEHWNGTSWSVVPSPNVGSGSAFYA